MSICQVQYKETLEQGLYLVILALSLTCGLTGARQVKWLKDTQPPPTPINKYINTVAVQSTAGIINTFLFSFLSGLEPNYIQTCTGPGPGV